MPVDDVKAAMLAPSETLTIAPRDFLSSGSTLLNLALSGKPNCGFAKGYYYPWIGDSGAGKTWLAMTLLAEAAYNPAFAEHRLIHDNAEYGALMNIGRYFGKLADRLEPPAADKNGPIYSSKIEDFYDNLYDLNKAGRPYVYILDSLDSLTSSAEIETTGKQRTARKKGTKSAGSYGDGKAKINSQNLRTAINELKKTGSILVIICQTRDNIGFGFETKTRAGGRAIRFYATAELWMAIRGKIKRKGESITGGSAGIRVAVQMKKNRFTGEDYTVEIPILRRHGIDDVGSCVDYLTETGAWPTNGTRITAPEFGACPTRSKLIAEIEADPKKIRELRKIVGAQWIKLEEAAAIKRRPRYQ